MTAGDAVVVLREVQASPSLDVDLLPAAPALFLQALRHGFEAVARFRLRGRGSQPTREPAPDREINAPCKRRPKSSPGRSRW